jgi:hypothetical protein
MASPLARRQQISARFQRVDLPRHLRSGSLCHSGNATTLVMAILERRREIGVPALGAADSDVQQLSSLKPE